jgi:putative sporulation protein YtxC
LLCAQTGALSYSPQSFEVVGHQLSIKYVLRDCDDMLHRIVVPAFTQFILLHKEHELIMSILQNTFFYSELDEQAHILQMVQSIMDGERTDIPQKTFDTSKERLIITALTHFLTDGVTFTFESFLQFRLKEYLERLMYYTGIGIDEYKLEQEYQVFVNQLREVIQDTKSVVPHVHVFHDKDDEFVFYNEAFQKIRDEERQHFCEAFLQQHRRIYIDKQVVAPLINMSPLKIYIYTSSPANTVIQTLQNIFEERVEIAHPTTFLAAEKLIMQQEVDF